MSTLLGELSLNSKDGQIAGYAWRRADASCVYAALPAGVGLLVTSLRRMDMRGSSHFGSRGRACHNSEERFVHRGQVHTSGANLGMRDPMKSINVTASVPLKIFCKAGMPLSMVI